MMVEETALVGEVVAIKLVTGEEILGKLVQQGDNTITIAQPFSMFMQPNAQGQQELGMIPYCIAASDADVPFNIRNINTMPVKASVNFSEGWISQTSPIAQPPSAGKIIT